MRCESLAFKILALLSSPFGLGDNNNMWRLFEPDKGRNNESLQEDVARMVDVLLRMLQERNIGTRTPLETEKECRSIGR